MHNWQHIKPKTWYILLFLWPPFVRTCWACVNPPKCHGISHLQTWQHGGPIAFKSDPANGHDYCRVRSGHQAALVNRTLKYRHGKRHSQPFPVPSQVFHNEWNDRIIQQKAGASIPIYQWRQMWHGQFFCEGESIKSLILSFNIQQYEFCAQI